MGRAVEVGEGDAGGSEDGEFAVGEEVDVARVVEDAGNVGGEEEFAVAEPRTTGGPKRAATSLLGSLAERTPMAKAPVRRLTARRTASSRGSACRTGAEPSA